ncbi:TetR/AcrR family transcriptional regulator [Parasedimentitalea maritima]|uniref:TetR/AcrR family transcriptional regulator n=1 Tax=Parasedimentitalea maritima TaxID=2578117 RepID=A0A6A4RGY3_9RHOB|nr:TetR/AcrR family transcriptional regulator [Zongyanglinia marina]KAE9628923.1 TetR/AcrR family transcriptional regulator [Zongyanglinia marina]
MSKPRLSQSDWIFAGFNALAELGPVALKAEVLARRIGSSKGSFYWHFTDVPSFHAAMMALWEQRAVTDVIDALVPLPDPRDRLRMLARLAQEKPTELDPNQPAESTIRAWARAAPLVRDTVDRVDSRRLEYLETLLAEAGVPPKPYARLIYAALIGLDDLPSVQGQSSNALVHLVDLILTLFPDPA